MHVVMWAEPVSKAREGCDGSGEEVAFDGLDLKFVDCKREKQTDSRCRDTK